MEVRQEQNITLTFEDEYGSYIETYEIHNNTKVLTGLTINQSTIDCEGNFENVHRKFINASTR